MLQAQAAQDVLALLDLALQGPDYTRMPDALNAHEDVGMAFGEMTAGSAEGPTGFGRIGNSYLPPIVWPATSSIGAGQSNGSFSRSVASEVQRMHGHRDRARHADGDMQQVQTQAGPSQLVKNLAAAGLVIVFGCVAIFAGKNIFASAKHHKTSKQKS